MRVDGRSRTRCPAAAVLSFVASILLGAVLAGCGAAPAADPEVDVSGDPGRAPTLTYVAPLQVSSVHRSTVWAGSGPPLVDGQRVLFDFLLENATDATVVNQTYDSKPRIAQLTPQSLGVDLYRTLSGARVGARLLQVAPGDSGSAADYPTVTVVDVLPLRAVGQAVQARSDLPTVQLGDAGAPSITPTGTGPPTTLVAQPLIRGAGAQVGAQDTVTFQYAGFAWSTGEEFDSSWSRGQPESQSLLDLPAAFSESLVEQTVGSQVEVVVPPSYSLKVAQSAELSGQTVVFVIDILASHPPASEGSS